MEVCPRCGAVHNGHRWIPVSEKAELPVAGRACSKGFESGQQGPHKRLCPGCVRVERHQVEGVVTITGGFLDEHRPEVKNVVRRVVGNLRRRNVSARVIDFREDDGKLVIHTTDRGLAERIGKELEKAFKGDLRIKWQRKDTFVRVAWQR